MIGIRADANDNVATGHIMRCLSVAEQLRKLGEDVLFIVSEPDYADRITNSGFEVFSLNNKCNEKDKELGELKEVLAAHNIKDLVVDSYEVTEKYLEELYKIVRLIYIDDMNSMKYPVDTIINYTYGTTQSDYIKWNYSDEVSLYTGIQYVPLREQFENRTKRVEEDAKNLFITAGGSDPYSVIKNLLCSLEGINIKLTKHIVIGSFYGDQPWLNNYANSHSEVHVYKNINNVADIMSKCDIAISASGTTLCELCACGIPTIAFTMADNQINGARSFGKDGLLIYAGDVRENSSEIINNIIINVESLTDNIDKRIELSTKQMSIIDGNGAMRIAAIIANHPLSANRAWQKEKNI